MKLKSLLHPLRAYKNKRRYNFYKSQSFRDLLLSDPKSALDIFWMVQVQKPLNWDNPKTLNEKNFWLEAYTDTTLWTQYSDKYLVRNYIEEKGLGHTLTKLYGTWNNAEDIDFDSLPNQFVLKCNHDCGSYIIVEDKSTIDKIAIRKKLQKCLETPYGYETVEPHYLRIHPVIIAEELLTNEGIKFPSSSLIDYKFFCIEGKAQCCMVCYDRGESTEAHDLYDITNWNRYKYISDKYSSQSFKALFPKPNNLDAMLKVVETLASGFHFVRVDLYNIGDRRIVFGELTFTPHGALQACFNDEGQYYLGDMIKL